MSAFFKVTVVLTAKEYATLRHEAAFLGPGTVGAAIRKRLGWYVTPYGYVKWAKWAAQKRQRIAEHDDINDPCTVCGHARTRHDGRNSSCADCPEPTDVVYRHRFAIASQ